ncbi:MAG: Crp/Fnr family transcriptional regulator [Thermodesulfobacteriota bacterium]|nr:Crp/Fnr family transcriptional regulator [Thermodesulfobacteriota bacterium]
MDSKQSFLLNIPGFRGLSKNQVEQVGRIAVEKKIMKGKIIFSEGDEGNGFYIVVKGRVKVFKVSPEGKEHILHIVGPGETFGQVAVYAGRSFPASSEAISQSHLLFIPRVAFVGLIADNPSLAMSMLAVLSLRLREFTIQIENLSLKEVPGRLASYLIYLADEQKTEDTISLPISKGQLASLLGTIPETLSRIFTKMSSQNLIQVSGGEIKISDRTGLDDLAMHGKL